MKQEEKFKLFDTVSQQITTTLKAKNTDYGDSFFNIYQKHGDLSTLIRLTDKLSRYETLIHNEAKVKDESINDTLLDIAGYCILTVVAKTIQKEEEQCCG